MDFETYAMKGQRPLGKRPRHDESNMSLDDRVAYCIGTMLDAANAFHKLHLKVNGQGSYATHKALGKLYDEIREMIDGIAEGYQGAAEVILDYSVNDHPPKVLNSVEEAVSYIRELSAKVTMMQQEIPYTEIVNDLDNLKSLFNSTKYKLLFLK